MHWYLQVLKKYAVFSGRATRKEFWMFTLIVAIILLVLGFIITITKPVSGEEASIVYILVTSFYWLFLLAHTCPIIAVSVRRLHDTGRSGWWYFISLIPLIGSIVIIVFFAQDSQPHDNEYGPNPKMVAETTLET